MYSRIFLIMGRFTNGEDDVVDIIDHEDDVVDIIDQAPKVRLKMTLRSLTHP